MSGDTTNFKFNTFLIIPVIADRTTIVLPGQNNMFIYLNLSVPYPMESSFVTLAHTVETCFFVPSVFL